MARQNRERRAVFLVELEDPSEYLKGEWVKQNNVTKLILLEEGSYVNKEFTDSKGQKESKRLFEVKVQCNDAKHSIKIYSPNNTSIKKMIELGKGDTKNLIGKELPIVPSLANGKWVIYIDPTYHMPAEQSNL